MTRIGDVRGPEEFVDHLAGRADRYPIVAKCNRLLLIENELGSDAADGGRAATPVLARAAGSGSADRRRQAAAVT